MSQTTDLAAADREALVALNLTIAQREQRRHAALAAPSPFSHRASSDASVTVVGDRAVCTLFVSTTKGGGSSASYRNIRVLSRRHGRWCVDAWFNEPAPPAVAP